MPRDIPVGNEDFLITFDQDYCLRDIYFPCVGKENHSDGHRFRFGVWTGGRFGWVNGRDWTLRLEYAQESLLTHVTARSDALGIVLHCNDVVDYKENIYLKAVRIENLSPGERECRIFFHHDFHILESPDGDTAYYDPDESAMIHYKEKRYFLMSGMRGDRHGIDQYSAGVKEFRGLEGTWRDAEDGELQGSPIAQGSVDSVVALHVKLRPNSAETVYYWICAGEDYAGVNRLNRMVVSEGPGYFIGRTDDYWRAWVNKEGFDFADLPGAVVALFKRSLLIMRTNIDFNGAIIAANDSDSLHFARDTYSYMWPRDGAFAAHSLDMAGYPSPTRRFFEFCFGVMVSGKETAGYFLHKYNPNGSPGSSWHPWVIDGEKILPIQEDSTGLVLWALWLHFDRYRDIESIMRHYETLVIRCGDFLASHRDADTGLPLPSYDLWEEHWGIHTFTASAVYAGLRAAERFAKFFGDAGRGDLYASAAGEIREAMVLRLYSKDLKRFIKSLVPGKGGGFVQDTTLDAGLYAPFYFGVLAPDDERIVNTMQAIRDGLWVKTPVGGIARYSGDRYQKAADGSGLPGNPWIICTLWLAQWQIARAKDSAGLKEALPLLEWVASRALPSGVLAEQIHPFSNQPLSVSPLTWSHAAFVAAVIEYLRKREETEICPTCGMPVYRHGRLIQ